jgi:NAD(P)-dependent dehydrogenase (short-subunit alcohol dehydrogenase family)
MISLNLSPDDVSFSNLKGKVAVITGGSSGIGLATAKLFSAHGAKILICDLQEPLEQIRGSVFAKCNVAIWADLLAAFDLALATFGAVDILVANAGVGGSKADFFQDEFDGEGRLKEPPTEVLDVNLKGVLMSVKIAIHEFKKSGKGGRIVMTASTAGLMGEMHLPVYSATKHGVSSLLPVPIVLPPLT